MWHTLVKLMQSNTNILQKHEGFLTPRFWLKLFERGFSLWCYFRGMKFPKKCEINFYRISSFHAIYCKVHKCLSHLNRMLVVSLEYH